MDQPIIPENPMMLFNGVRTSCDILARKSDFKRSLSSAFSLASMRSSPACLRLVISTPVPYKMCNGFVFIEDR